jgi:hypothetical protein
MPNGHLQTIYNRTRTSPRAFGVRRSGGVQIGPSCLFKAGAPSASGISLSWSGRSPDTPGDWRSGRQLSPQHACQPGKLLPPCRTRMTIEKPGGEQPKSIAGRKIWLASFRALGFCPRNYVSLAVRCSSFAVGEAPRFSSSKPSKERQSIWRGERRTIRFG